MNESSADLLSSFGLSGLCVRLCVLIRATDYFTGQSKIRRRAFICVTMVKCFARSKVKVFKPDK